MTVVEKLLLGPALLGVLFVLTGYIFRKYPPKKINHFYGYRTSSSMRSQERWDFSQPYAAKVMINHGYMLSLLGIVCWLLPIEEVHQLAIITVVVLILSCILMIYDVEKAIKKKFADLDQK